MRGGTRRRSNQWERWASLPWCSWTGSSPWDEVLVKLSGVDLLLTPPNVSTNLHPPPTPSGDDSWPHCDWPPTKRDGLGRWRLSNPTSSPAPRAVKMPTFGRVAVVFVSTFRQASLRDRNNSPLTLIVKKCGRYDPLSCVCSSVRVCSVTSEEKINQRLFPVKSLFQFPVVPSQSCGFLSSRSPFFCPKLTLLHRNCLKILVLTLSQSHPGVLLCSLNGVPDTLVRLGKVRRFGAPQVECGYVTLWQMLFFSPHYLLFDLDYTL